MNLYFLSYDSAEGHEIQEIITTLLNTLSTAVAEIQQQVPGNLYFDEFIVSYL